jgi:hypothetical protein
MDGCSTGKSRPFEYWRSLCVFYLDTWNDSCFGSSFEFSTGLVTFRCLASLQCCCHDFVTNYRAFRFMGGTSWPSKGRLCGKFVLVVRIDYYWSRYLFSFASSGIYWIWCSGGCWVGDDVFIASHDSYEMVSRSQRTRHWNCLECVWSWRCNCSHCNSFPC